MVHKSIVIEINLSLILKLYLGSRRECVMKSSNN